MSKLIFTPVILLMPGLTMRYRDYLVFDSNLLMNNCIW